MRALSRTALLPLLAVTTAALGCRAQVVRRTLLEHDAVVVTAQVLHRSDGLTLRAIEVEGGASAELLSLDVRVFVDVDGDGSVAATEIRRAWSVESGVPTRRLAVSGSFDWDRYHATPGGIVDTGDRWDDYLVEVVVELVEDRTLRAVVPLSARR